MVSEAPHLASEWSLWAYEPFTSRSFWRFLKAAYSVADGVHSAAH